MDASEHKTRSEYAELEAKLADSSLFGTPEYVKYAKRQTELKPLMDLYEQRAQLQSDLEALNDPELADLAAVEKPIIEEKLIEVQERLRLALVPKDPSDSKDVIVEIRAGAGGDESTLFASEMYRMYARYAEQKGWKLELVSESPSDVGGYKELSFEIHGQDVYSEMKYESGVHRVQRVPSTESQGRVHTSTVTVAVLPVAEETDLVINDNDLRIDVYRSGGNGGQSVNTTDSAVRITHIPTGTVVAIQDEKSQLKNKQKAMSVLRSRLLAHQQAIIDAENSDIRKSQVRTMDRSERIRTYNYPENRIADHRTGYKAYNLDHVMNGDLEPVIQSAIEMDEQARLDAIGD